MLQLLAMAKRPLCVCELENQFDLTQPTVSHHLRILREAGVVNATRRGTWVFYELNAKPLKLLRKLETLLCADSCGCGPACKTKPETQHD
jgi:ArsR family transcriptional regulator